MKIESFALLGAGQYESLCAAFKPDVDAWLDGWFKQPPAAMLTVAAISQGFDDYRLSAGIRFADISGEQWAACGFDQTTQQRLCDMLLSGQDASVVSSRPTDIVSGMTGSALMDLIAHVLPPAEDEYLKSMQDTVGACIPDSAFQPGNEALHLKIDLEGLDLHVWLPVRPFLPRIAFPSPTMKTKARPLVKPKETLSNQAMRFRVMLGSADLTLGSIASLKVGDVIRLDKDLQDPLALIFENSPAKFAGYLGKMRNCYSFQIDALLR